MLQVSDKFEKDEQWLAKLFSRDHIYKIATDQATESLGLEKAKELITDEAVVEAMRQIEAGAKQRELLRKKCLEESEWLGEITQKVKEEREAVEHLLLQHRLPAAPESGTQPSHAPQLEGTAVASAPTLLVGSASASLVDGHPKSSHAQDMLEGGPSAIASDDQQRAPAIEGVSTVARVDDVPSIVEASQPDAGATAPSIPDQTPDLAPPRQTKPQGDGKSGVVDTQPQPRVLTSSSDQVREPPSASISAREGEQAKDAKRLSPKGEGRVGDAKTHRRNSKSIEKSRGGNGSNRTEDARDLRKSGGGKGRSRSRSVSRSGSRRGHEKRSSKMSKSKSRSRSRSGSRRRSNDRKRSLGSRSRSRSRSGSKNRKGKRIRSPYRSRSRSRSRGRKRLRQSRDESRRRSDSRSKSGSRSRSRGRSNSGSPRGKGRRSLVSSREKRSSRVDERDTGSANKRKRYDDEGQRDKGARRHSSEEPKRQRPAEDDWSYDVPASPRREDKVKETELLKQAGLAAYKLHQRRNEEETHAREAVEQKAAQEQAAKILQEERLRRAKELRAHIEDAERQRQKEEAATAESQRAQQQQQQKKREEKPEPRKQEEEAPASGRTEEETRKSSAPAAEEKPVEVDNLRFGKIGAFHRARQQAIAAANGSAAVVQPTPAATPNDDTSGIQPNSATSTVGPCGWKEFLEELLQLESDRQGYLTTLEKQASQVLAEQRRLLSLMQRKRGEQSFVSEHSEEDEFIEFV